MYDRFSAPSLYLVDIQIDRDERRQVGRRKLKEFLQLTGTVGQKLADRLPSAGKHVER